MWRRPSSVSIIAALSTCLAGCSLLLHPAASATRSTQMSMDELGELETHFAAPDDIVRQFDPSRLKAGHHVQIVTGVPPETLPQEILSLLSGIAGTVKEVFADRVILVDVVVISARPTQHAVPIAGKLPYFGRLFKNAPVVRREVTPVPGEVAIELSEIRHAKELTDTAFEQVKQYGAERIGVDFDFAAEGEP